MTKKGSGVDDFGLSATTLYFRPPAGQNSLPVLGLPTELVNHTQQQEG